MIIFLLGLLLFFAIHSVSIIDESFRTRMVEKIGEWPWKSVYSVISLVGLVLIVRGYKLAQPDAFVLYTSPIWLKHIALLLLLPVFVLLIAAYLPGRIKAAARHSMLLSVKLWAVAHLFANGTLVDVMLFGSFFLWAIVDRLSLERRVQRATPAAPPTRYNDAIAVIAGLGLYLTFLFQLHELLFGVSPL